MNEKTLTKQPAHPQLPQPGGITRVPSDKTPAEVADELGAVVEVHQRVLKGTTSLLMGAPGAGKTWAIITLLKAGLEVFVIITDPGGEETLLDSLKAHGLPIDKLHWHYIPPAAPKWSDLQDMALKINTMSFEDLGKLKTGISKRGYTQFYELLSTMANFKCDRTGVEFGPIDSWDYQRAVVIDSFSGLNTMAWTMTVGAKPTAHVGEWGVAMTSIERLLDKLTADLRCFFVLNAHVERELDEVGGGVKIMVSTLGRKLAPKIPRNFSDIILAYREGTEFFWSTVTAGVDLKTRTLPLRDKIDPDFSQIVDVWRERNQLAEVTP